MQIRLEVANPGAVEVNTVSYIARNVECAFLGQRWYYSEVARPPVVIVLNQWILVESRLFNIVEKDSRREFVTGTMEGVNVRTIQLKMCVFCASRRLEVPGIIGKETFDPRIWRGRIRLRTQVTHSWVTRGLLAYKHPPRVNLRMGR